jgi:arginine-tRNA-protein transferase
MFDNKTFFINEEFFASKVSPPEMDAFWADGWRHFGEFFFRYNLAFYEKEIRRVIPLRIRLTDFSPSKSQRRILKRNQDLQIFIRPAEITTEKSLLFNRHKRRFKRGAPRTIYDFLSFETARAPCEVLEVCVVADEKLLAASFFAVGEVSVSAIYAMFAPEEGARSLGIFTILLEIDFAQKRGKEFYYQGYAYEKNSFYDYKKRFNALEQFDWYGHWEVFRGE